MSTHITIYAVQMHVHKQNIQIYTYNNNKNMYQRMLHVSGACMFTCPHPFEHITPSLYDTK